MNISTNRPLKLWQSLSPALQDLLVCIAIVISATIASIATDVAERFTTWSEQYEHLQVDELPIILLVIAITSTWFATRRMRELREEIVRRVAAEEQLRETTHLYKSLFEDGLTGNFLATDQGELLLCNDAFMGMAGRKCDELNLAEALSGLWDTLTARLDHERIVEYPNLSVTRPDGAPWIVSARFTKTSWRFSSCDKAICGYFADITEQFLAEKELSNLLRENRELNQHAMQVQELERRRISQELHDDMGQYLTAIRLDAAALQTNENPATSIHARRIASNAEHIHHTVKTMITRLRPVPLDQHGLPDALSHMVREWGSQNKATVCHLIAEDLQAHPVPDNIRIATYRIVQEALTNIARHANASNVVIDVHLGNTPGQDHIAIAIIDDGCGIKHDPNKKSFGLIGMRERAESAGGSFKISSKQGSGVRIYVQLPFSTPALSSHPSHGV